MKKKIFTGIFVTVLLALSIVSGTLSINTFGPGDVSSFTVTSDDSSYYIEIDEDTYTSDFTVTTAEVNVSMDEVLLPIISFGGDDLGDINDFSLVESWDTDPPGVGANDVSGIAYDEEGYIWMVDYIDEEIYQFYKNGTYLDNWDIHTSGADDIHGITNYGEYLYVVDEVDDEVYVFNKTSENLLDNWDISGQTGSPRGITTDGTYIWIVEGNPRIYKYYTNGTYIDYLQLAGYSPQGITIYEDNIFILDDTDNEIVILDLDGNLKGAIDVEPHNTMSGVTTDGEYIWGVFPADDVVNKYNFYTTSDEQLDFSTELTTSMNSCTGDPCKLYFNITGEDWGNVTLDGLDIEINTRPTTPTTLSPDNNSVWFNDPTLTCSGSTDLDGDDINYSFIAEGYASLQNSSSTTYEWEDLEAGSYNWRCQACDNSSCSDFTETRTLYKMDFEECDSGNVSLNFTGRDEETEDLLIPDMTFDAAWTLESAWDALLYNFGLTGANNYTFCLNPAGLDVNITGFVEYDSTNSSYSFPRQYYFQDAIINGDTSNEIDLFQLSDTFATPITFTALRGATTVEDVLIHVQRYDPGTGDYTLVAMGETGANGQDIIYMRMTDAWYRILAYSDGVLEFVGDPEHILSSSYTIYLTGGAGGMSDYWDNWESLDSINYNLAFNESGTNHVTLTADDGSGASTAMCLKVEKWTMLDGMEELYYSCESSASITMSYEITDLDATYNAKFIAFFDGGWRMMDSEEIALTTNLSDLIGPDGIIYAMLFIGIIAFVGLWNPVASVALTMFGLIISFMMGLISVPWSALIGILIAGGIILFKIRE